MQDEPPTTDTPRWQVGLALLALGVLALLLRVLNLGGFVTLDEVTYWFARSERFLFAIQSGLYADTAITSHPGVTTMWLGGAGILLRETLWGWGLLSELDFATSLFFIRLPLALVQSAGVVVGCWLLTRLLPVPAAVLAGVFWAADPFVLAFSRILHVDALLATFATLSLLALCVYSFRTPHTGYLLLSAVCAALAVLSKSPGLALLPIAGLVLLLRRPFSLPHSAFSPLHSAFSILLWGGAFGLTLLLVWPAVWADPVGVYRLLRFGIEVEGAAPHMQGNFFLGQPTEAPGPLFYPVALALRLTPITLVGVLLLPVGWRRLDAHTRRSLLVLLAFVLLFTLAMSLFPKKFNRYLVPVFPALDVLAAVGLASLMHHASFMAHRCPRIVYRFPFSFLPSPFSLLILLAVLNAAHWHPYHVAAFNQVLGGAPAGARTFVIGWGEGMGQVADWLNQQPDSTGVTVASTMRKTLQPYLRAGVQAVTPPAAGLEDNTGYVVVDVSQPQRQRLRPPFTDFYPAATPLHVVSLHGVDYAWIYDVPAPMQHTVGRRFGAAGGQPAIELQGYSLDSTALRERGMLSVAVQWQAHTRLASDYMLFVHLLDDDGQRVGQIDVSPGGPAQPTSTWQVGRYVRWQNPLPLPPDLPAGDYWLALGLYDPADFARLPLPGYEPPPGAPAAGGNALLLPVAIAE